MDSLGWINSMQAVQNFPPLKETQSFQGVPRLHGKPESLGQSDLALLDLDHSMLISQKPFYLQVEEYVESRIVSGAFPSGSRLPSNLALAKATGASAFTVQTALKRLAHKGLLDRKVRHATYVRGEVSALTCVALYFAGSLSRTDMAFFSVLGQEITRQLETKGIQTEIWTDNRKSVAEPLDSLVRAVGRLEAQAIIAPLINEESLSWISKMDLPFAFMTARGIHNHSVIGGTIHLVRTAFAEFKRRGCRTVGLITNVLVDPQAPQAGLDFYQELNSLLMEYGLSTREEWIRKPEHEEVHLSTYGYQQFHEMRKAGEMPDGLLVSPDNAVPGVITAILECGEKVSRDLQLIFHANDLIPYPCPLPASFVMTEMKTWAAALIEQVYRQLEDQELAPIHVGFTLVPRQPEPTSK
jgi:DNA-binding transcriptional regulator YhcF (GntR family)